MRRARRVTEVGHRSTAGADPADFSAATCRIRLTNSRGSLVMTASTPIASSRRISRRVVDRPHVELAAGVVDRAQQRRRREALVGHHGVDPAGADVAGREPRAGGAACSASADSAGSTYSHDFV